MADPPLGAIGIWLTSVNLIFGCIGSVRGARERKCPGRGILYENDECSRATGFWETNMEGTIGVHIQDLSPTPKTVQGLLLFVITTGHGNVTDTTY